MAEAGVEVASERTRRTARRRVAGAVRRDRCDYWKEGRMAKRKAPASSAEVAPAKGRPTKAEAAKAALKARQPDLLDLLTECTAPGSLDNGLAYAACLKVCPCQAVRMSAGLRWPFFSINHSAL